MSAVETEAMTEKRADDLISFPGGSVAHDRLEDGAHVLHLSFQLEWIYVKVLTQDGHFRTRRYRYGQMVKVQR